MSVPVSQMWAVASYVLGKRLRGIERYPLVLMLEPLFRCNLACFGCGKIQHPVETLRRHLSEAERPFPSGSATPTADEALARLGEVLTAITVDVLDGPRRELHARRQLIRGLEPGLAEDLDAEIAAAVQRAIAAECSQRVVALGTITETLGACVKTFFEMFPAAAGGAE